MLTEIHTALMGEPFSNPPRKGALAKVEEHDQMLSGSSNWEGLIKSHIKLKGDFYKYVYIGGGIVVTLQAIWAVYAVIHFGSH